MRSPRRGLSSCNTRHICSRQADKPECRTTIGTIMKKSNEPTKTKSKMKKTMRFLSMAALALVGAMMTGCSSDDNFIDEPQQPENKSNVVTLTTTVGFGEGAEARGTTRALTSGGVKTFATGETMAIIYKNNSGETVKAVSTALPDGDYGNSATFTFTLDDPDKTKSVMYIYPAAMAKATIATDATIDEANTVDFTNLNAQNGTLATLSSSLDLATYSNDWDGTSLPAGTLVNQLAVCALTLKNSDGSSTITSGLTEVTVSDGSNTYTVTPTGSTFGEDVIYVAIRPVTAALEYTATDGTKNYTKTATSREYAAGNFYNLGLRMAEAAPVSLIVNPAVGQVIGDDGKNYDYASLPGGVTAVAVIAYVGAAGTADASSATYKGLALALTDASTAARWSTWTDATCLTSQKTDETAAKGDMAGIANTDELVAHTSHPHAAAKAAREYNGGAHPTGTSAWFLPSAGQWEKMISAYGLTNLNTTANGYTGLNNYYWSSTECSNVKAWDCNFASSGSWGNYDKNYEDHVRACLAF